MELFPARLYEPIYLLVVTILTIILAVSIQPKGVIRILKRRHVELLSMVGVVVFIFIVGFRPVSPFFGDTINYANTYESFKYATTFNGGADVLFYRLMYECSKVMDVSFFFLIIEILYVVPLYLACRRLAKTNSDLMLLFVFSAFSFFTYSVNGLRNGVACSIVLLAMTFIQGKMSDKILCAFLCLIAYNFHHSAALPIVCMFPALFIKDRRVMFSFWFFSIILSLLAGGAISSFFAGLGFDDRLDQYLLMSEEEAESYASSVGFRWDFLLYSFMPILLGMYVILKKKVYDRTYLLLLGTYIYANSFWIMVIRSGFSNRFAYLSWFLYPIVLAYPLLKLPIWKHTQGQNTAIIMLGHLAFTLIMFFLA